MGTSNLIMSAQQEHSIRSASTLSVEVAVPETNTTIIDLTKSAESQPIFLPPLPSFNLLQASSTDPTTEAAGTLLLLSRRLADQAAARPAADKISAPKPLARESRPLGALSIASVPISKRTSQPKTANSDSQAIHKHLMDKFQETDRGFLTMSLAHVWGRRDITPTNSTTLTFLTKITDALKKQWSETDLIEVPPRVLSFLYIYQLKQPSCPLHTPSNKSLSEWANSRMLTPVSSNTTVKLILPSGKEYDSCCPSCLSSVTQRVITSHKRVGECFVFTIVGRLPGGSGRGGRKAGSKDSRRNKNQDKSNSAPLPSWIDEQLKNSFPDKKQRGPPKPKDTRVFIKKVVKLSSEEKKNAVIEEVTGAATQEEEANSDDIIYGNDTVITSGNGTDDVGPSGETSSNYDPRLSQEQEYGQIQAPPTPETPVNGLTTNHRHMIHKWKCECAKSCFPLHHQLRQVEIDVLRTNGMTLITASGVNALLNHLEVERRSMEPRPLYIAPHIRNIRQFCANHRVEWKPPSPLHDEKEYLQDYFSIGDPSHRTWQSDASNNLLSAFGHSLSLEGHSYGDPIDKHKIESIMRTPSFLNRRTPTSSSRGECHYDWVMPVGCETATSPGHAIKTDECDGTPGHVPVGALFTKLLDHRVCDTTTVTNSHVGFGSRWVHRFFVFLKHHAFNAIRSRHEPGPFSFLSFLLREIPAAPVITPMPGFSVGPTGLLSNIGAAPPLPPPVQTLNPARNSFSIGTFYKSNIALSSKSLRHLVAPGLSLRQRLFASGLLGNLSPRWALLTPGPAGCDPGVAVTVECVSAPHLDPSYTPFGHVDLRTDQNLHSELLHQECVVQTWNYRLSYLGTLINEIEIKADSNALTALFNTKSSLHPGIDPKTRNLLLCEDTAKLIAAINVEARASHEVITPIQAAAAVGQIKALDLTETQLSLGYAGSVSVFH